MAKSDFLSFCFAAVTVCLVVTRGVYAYAVFGLSPSSVLNSTPSTHFFRLMRYFALPPFDAFDCSFAWSGPITGPRVPSSTAPVRRACGGGTISGR